MSNYFANFFNLDDKRFNFKLFADPIDEAFVFEDIQFKGQFSNWNFVQGYDDGTNGDETANDGVWTAVIDSVVGPNSYQWGAVECDSTCYDGIGNDNEGYITEVMFDIDFEIENKFLNILMTKSFQFGLEKIADAFQKRAESIK